MSGIKEKLIDDLKEAMRKGNEVERSILRLLRADIRNEEIAQRTDLDDEGCIKVISRQVKRHKESIEEFTKGNRLDLVAREKTELTVLLKYLPAQMSRDEIVEIARQVIREMGALGPGDRGKVMGQVMAKVKGKADGREVNQIVSELLEKQSK
ncbi:MAG: GatB/YqeY domain-containing protein [Dehalococcoidia bacterium]